MYSENRYALRFLGALYGWPATDRDSFTGGIFSAPTRKMMIYFGSKPPMSGQLRTCLLAYYEPYYGRRRSRILDLVRRKERMRNNGNVAHEV